MKKIMALCLAAIMVFSIFSMPAMAATITVPATAMVDGEFANLTAIPSDWTIAGKEGTNYKFDAKGIAPAATAVNYGYVQINTKDAFDTKGANYTFSVKLSHYDGTQYIHFGAATIADATMKGVSDTGYTFTATHYNTTAGNGYNYKGQYALYKNGTKISDLADAGSVWAYQNVREFKFYVTDEGITASGAVTETAIEDATPVTSGYVGAYIVNNSNANLTLVNLAAMKLVTEEYSYDVTTDETNTGAYVVLGTKYEESHEGTMYFNHDFKASTEAPQGVTTNGGSFGNSTYGFTCTGTVSMNLGEYTVDDDVIIEASVNALPWSNDHIFTFFGYKLHLDPQAVAGTSDYVPTAILTNSADDTFKLTWTGKASDRKGGNTMVPVVIKLVDGKINVTINNLQVFTNEDDLSVDKRTRSGSIGVRFDYVNGGGKIASIKMYSSDYRDTSSYVDITRSDFLFERDFSVNDATIAELRNQNFVISGDGINEEGLYKNEGTASAEYTGHKFKGAYTLETRETGNYKNPGTIVFNKTADGDYYCLAALGGSWSFYKMQGGVKTILEDNTTTEASDDEAFYANPRITKVSLIPSSDNATLDIKVVLNGKEIVTVTDTTPITKAGTFKVTTGYNKPSTLDYIKVYPNGTNPTYTASFVVDGTETADFAKGNTLLKFPTAMIGQKPAIVAALYENDEMTDVKIIDVDALNIGVAELFDTTGSTATKVSIKVFVWNSIEGMSPILDPFVLD